MIDVGGKGMERGFCVLYYLMDSKGESWLGRRAADVFTTAYKSIHGDNDCSDDESGPN